MRTWSRKLFVILAGVILAGFVVYQSGGFIHKANFSGEKLLHAVAGANLYWLLLSVVVIYVCYGVRALRWQLFQGNLGSSRFWIIYKMTLAGFAAIFILSALPMTPSNKIHKPALRDLAMECLAFGGKVLRPEGVQQ